MTPLEEIAGELADLQARGVCLVAMADHTGAERQRRRRERAACGVRIIAVEVSEETIERAVAAGIIPLGASEQEIAFHLGELLERAVEDVARHA